MKKEQEEKVEKVNQPENAPVVQDTQTVPSMETLSHQWQKDSPALNTNELAGYSTAGKSILDKIDTPEKKKAREVAEELKHDECAHMDYEARIRLDVSHRCYLNPSLDHKEAKKVK